MAANDKEHKQKIGWIGAGPHGDSHGRAAIKAGHDVTIWNRTRAKAEPLAKIGGKLVDHLSELKNVDVLFSIVVDRQGRARGPLRQERRLQPGRQAAADRRRLLDNLGRGIRRRSVKSSSQLGAEFVAAPVSGNAKVIKAGKLPRSCRGPRRHARR